MTETFVQKVHMLKACAISAIAALIVSAPLTAFAADAAPTATKVGVGTASCNTVISKTKEFRDSSHEQIAGICKTNQNSPAYWSCMNTRIDKGQGFADAGMRCNKITAKTTASR
jgi:hypothetical protein